MSLPINGNQYFRSTSSPRFRLKYTQGLPSILNSTSDFTSLEMNYRQSIMLSPVANLEVFGQVGQMFRSKSFFQMDALHLYGNETFVLGKNNIEQFRNLPYYSFSSQKRIASLHVHFFRNELIFGWLAKKKKKTK